jgi:hypothetical protein
MALRDNPYLPLYVQDYLTDEKLSCCTLATQGVYIRIMCVFHKSDTYGGILFKQIPKQNFSSNQYFAFVLSKMTGVEVSDMEAAISELLFFNVLKIVQRYGVDFLFQKRMVKDFTKSEKRSRAGKKGGGNPVLFKQTDKQISENVFKQTDKQKPEYEYENEYVDEYVDGEEKGGMGENGGGGENGGTGEKEGAGHLPAPEEKYGEAEKLSPEPELVEAEVFDELSFENVWEMYGRKGNQKESEWVWANLPAAHKQLAVEHIPRYVAATPERQYRKNFENYINLEAWNDEFTNEFAADITGAASGHSGGQEVRLHTYRNDAEKRRAERQELARIAEGVLQQP